MTAITKPGPAYKVATLDTLSDDQIHTIRNLPPHEDYVAPVIDERRPVSMFQSQEQYDLEQKKVFRRLPMPVTVSLMLPEPGSVVAHNDYGVPIVMTRDKQGKVRAFLNSCQHKGALLIEDCESHKTGRLSCPYHAWTYGLDGQLIGVPRQETFANFDKASRNLKELPCAEIGGVIWVILDPKAEPDFSSIPAQIKEDLDKLGMAEQHLYGRRTFDVAANWKLVLEPFLEAYHVQRLHAATVGPLFADGCTKLDTFGAHIRQISGKVHFKPEMLEEAGKNIHGLVTITYQLFPNLVIITSPYYMSAMFILPQSPTTSKVELFITTLEPPANEKAAELYARSYEMVQSVFGGEDFRAAEISQKGLATGALTEVIYSGLEHPIVDYYNSLDEALAG